MKKIVTRSFKRTIAVLVSFYFILFGFRLTYSYLEKSEMIQQAALFANEWNPDNNNLFNEISGKSWRNIASEKMSKSKDYADRAQIHPPAVELPDVENQIDLNTQKYEKKAQVGAVSSDFEKDEIKTRSFVKENKGIIQYEKVSGQPGRRLLSLAVGVEPSEFDNLSKSLKSIGKNTAFDVTLKDLTSEFRELQSKRLSLEKFRSSIVSLRGQGGKIEEKLSLEAKVREIDEELQGLGVSLGEFSGENELSTVEFQLSEKKTESVKTVSVISRMKASFSWASVVYFRSMLGLFFAALAAFFVVAIIEKTKILQAVVKGLEGNTVQ